MRSNGDKNENITGTVFIRWGRNSCPKNDTGEITLVYSGYTASSSINRDGGSIVCLPQDPQWNRYDNKTLASTTGWLGVEYYGDELFDNVHRDNDAPCAVCYVALRSTMILIPGRKTCYPGWTTEYSGYQMSVIGTHTICIDEEPEGIAGGEARGNYMKRMFFTKIRCGTNTLCPPYVEERQLTCVVCTK